MYGIERKGIQLRLEDHSQGVSLDMQRMIPCGLAVNELLLNAVKHAFSQTEEGIIVIRVVLEHDSICIVVRDNGCGLPPGFQWKSSYGLGSQLIPMFVHQLHAELLTQSSSLGTTISIRIPAIGQEYNYAG